MSNGIFALSKLEQVCLLQRYEEIFASQLGGIHVTLKNNHLHIFLAKIFYTSAKISLYSFKKLELFAP